MRVSWVGTSTLVVILLGTSNSVALREKIKFSKDGVPLEAPEVAADTVALTYKTKAIASLRTIVRRQKGRPAQIDYMLQLARLQLELAEIEFRLAHQRAFLAKKPIDLLKYRRLAGEAASTLTNLIRQFPRHSSIPDAYYQRARAYVEMDRKNLALRDYYHISKRYPKFPEIHSVYVEIAEQAAAAGQHTIAIEYLQKLLKNKRDKNYPYFLQKIAWAYHNIGQLDRALTYVKLFAKYYSYAGQGVGDNQKTELAEDLLLDGTLFYLTGWEKGNQKMAPRNAVAYFRSIAAETGSMEILELMIVRYAKLLRAHDHTQQLAAYKAQVLGEFADRQAAIDVLLIVLEDQLTRFRYKEFAGSLNELGYLFREKQGKLDFENAKGFLARSAEKVQKRVGKKSKQKGLQVLITSIYDLYLKFGLASKKPKQLFLVRYNLAEALLALGKQDDAVRHFEWILENIRRDEFKDVKTGLNMTDIGMKLSSLYYEQLKARKIIPGQIKAMKISKMSRKTLDPAFKSWVKLIARLKREAKQHPQYGGLTFYAYETLRTYYANGHPRIALVSLKRFAKKGPRGKYAVPAASLVIDTYIAEEDWRKVHSVATDFRAVKEWQPTPFGHRLEKIAADSYYKVLEQAYNDGNYKEVTQGAAIFEKHYANSPRKVDFLNLVANASMANNDKATASRYFSKLTKNTNNTEYLGRALLVTGAEKEEKKEYMAAVTDYYRYLKLPKKSAELKEEELNSLRTKILYYTWVFGHSNQLFKLIGDGTVCVPKLAVECERYEVTLLLTGGPVRKGNLAGMKAKMAGPNGVLWSLASLEKLGMRIPDRLEALKRVAAGWTQLDPTLQFVLISKVSNMFPVTFRRIRQSISAGRVQADQSSITRKVQQIQFVEGAAMEIVKMPWARVQASVLNEVASLYLDLASKLSGMPVPPGMSIEEIKVYKDTLAQVAAPFKESGVKILQQAYEIASKYSVEGREYRRIAKNYFEQNRELAKKIWNGVGFPQNRNITLRIIQKVAPEVVQRKPAAIPANEKLPEGVASSRMWLDALKARKWVKVGYYLQDVQLRKGLPTGLAAVMTAISLVSVGARAEGLVELEKVREELSGSQRKYVDSTLMGQYLNTLAVDKIKTLLEDLDEKDLKVLKLTKDESVFVARLR